MPKANSFKNSASSKITSHLKRNFYIDYCISNTDCELTEFRVVAITAVCVRSGRMLSVVPRRIEVHSSYHQLRKETHFSEFRTHAFPTVVKNWRAFFISHRPPLTQTGLSFMFRSQSEY